MRHPKFHVLLVSIGAFGVLWITGNVNAAAVGEQRCNFEGCQKIVQISDEATQCVRIELPTTRDGALERNWATQIEFESASRLNGEDCTNTDYFLVDSDSADAITLGLRLLHQGLRIERTLLSKGKLESDTYECLIRDGSPRVHDAMVEESSDGTSEVLFEIEGCEKGVLQVSARMRLDDVKSASVKDHIGIIDLSYSPRATPVPGAIRGAPRDP